MASALVTEIGRGRMPTPYHNTGDFLIFFRNSPRLLFQIISFFGSNGDFAIVV
jgi:hypothetical protein